MVLFILQAAGNGMVDIMDILGQKDVNCLDNYGETPLHSGARLVK